MIVITDHQSLRATGHYIIICFPSQPGSATGLELEDEHLSMVLPEPHHTASFPGAKCGRTTWVFFKPVDNNMAYQTFLGSGFNKKIDFVAQIFMIANFNVDRFNNVTDVHIGKPSGAPMAMKLCDVAYDVLSDKLKIWKPGQTEYHAQARLNMCRGSCTNCCNRLRAACHHHCRHKTLIHQIHQNHHHHFFSILDFVLCMYVSQCLIVAKKTAKHLNNIASLLLCGGVVVGVTVVWLMMMT